MPRSLWSGSLSFGLVNVPVKVVTAVRQKELKFHQVHESDGGRIRYKRVCEVDGKEVPYEEISKMSEEGGAPVLITEEDLAAVKAERSDLIEITDFVKLDQVDPLYFEKPYYLVPDKGGEKAYRLMVEAMQDKGQVAIAKIVFRDRERLVAVRPLGRALTMSMMNYGDEVILPEDLEGVPEAGKTPKKEIDMAKRLIEELASDFEPTKYKDEHRERLLDLIATKREGGILMPVPKGKHETTTDLTAALEASLAAIRKGRKADA